MKNVIKVNTFQLYFYLLLIGLVFLFRNCQSDDSTIPEESQTSTELSSKPSKGNGKVDVCHYSEDTNDWHLISISLNAVSTHLAHGDIIIDEDGDGYAVFNDCNILNDNGIDCNDTDSSINPGAIEICDGIDNDCDGYSDINASQIGCITPPSNMISWWDGDSITGTTAEDIQGNNNGTLPNGINTTSGKVGDAFSFDGSNYMIANSPIINGFEELTIDMWVKPNSIYGRSLQAIAGIQTFHAGPTDSTGFYTYQGSQGQIVFTINTPSGLGYTRGIANYGVTSNQWTHIAGTYDGVTLKLYVNGELVPNVGSNIGSTITTSSGSRLQGPIQLSGAPYFNFALATSHWNAHNNAFPAYQFYGEIDEVEIFNRALTASEIHDVYAADTAGKCKPCKF